MVRRSLEQCIGAPQSTDLRENNPEKQNVQVRKIEHLEERPDLLFLSYGSYEVAAFASVARKDYDSPGLGLTERAIDDGVDETQDD
jgi:hypothetical protein